MNRKKLLLVVVAALMVLSLATGVAAEGKKLKIAFIPQLIGIPYFTAMEQGGKDAAKAFNVDFTYIGATTASAPEQVRIMESLLKQQYDAVSISALPA